MEETQTSPSVEPAEAGEEAADTSMEDFDAHMRREGHMDVSNEPKSEPADNDTRLAEESAAADDPDSLIGDETVAEADDESAPTETTDETPEEAPSEPVETVEQRRERMVKEFGQDFVDQFANEHAQQMVGKQGSELGEMRTALDKAHGQTVEGLLRTDPERVRQLLEEHDQSGNEAATDDLSAMAVRPREFIQSLIAEGVKEELGEMARKSQYDRGMAAKYSGEESLDALAKTREMYKAAYLRGDVSLDEILHKAVIADGIKSKALRAVEKSNPDKPQVPTGAPGAGGSGAPARVPGSGSKSTQPDAMKEFDEFHRSGDNGPRIMDQTIPME